MIKRFISFIVFYPGLLFADTLISSDIVGGCDATSLLSVNDTTKMTPVFRPLEYTCSSGSFLPANTLGCKTCPNGYVCTGGTFFFNETIAQGITPKNIISQTSSKICSVNMLNTQDDETRLKPVFEPIKYTCSSGSFLPADTLGCRTCPAGYVCPGGTFPFSETRSHGINPKELIIQDASYFCSANTLNTVKNKTILLPAFKPNILTLTWNYEDGTGRTEQTTCTYDTPITDIPEEPVRPGYKFMGWRVKVPEQQAE